MMTIEHVNQFPFSSKLPETSVNGRNFVIMPYYHLAEWNLPFPLEKGKWVLGKGAIPHSGLHLAGSFVDENTDIYVGFIETLFGSLSWEDVVPIAEAIANDLLGLFISISKIDFFWAKSDSRMNSSDFVTSEIEHMLVSCRGVFDRVQSAFGLLWNKYVKLDGISKSEIALGFSKIVLDKNRPRTSEEIAQKFGLPKPIADAYANASGFFCSVKELRDAIVHKGRDFELIYMTDKCFAARPGQPFFSKFPIYRTDEPVGNELYSIRPALEHLVDQTIELAGGLFEGFLHSIKFPASVYASDFHVFMRSPHIGRFVAMKKELRSSSFWSSNGP